MDTSNKFWTIVLNLLVNAQKDIERAYYEAIINISIAAAAMNPKPGTFDLKRYPRLDQATDKALIKLQGKLHTTVVNGVNRSWSLSNEKNTVYVDDALKGMELSPKAKAIYYDAHNDVKEAFLKKETEGLTLSDRVWNLTKEFKKEIALGVHQGIATGESAKEMAKRMQKYLKVPDDRFNDVKDETLRKQLKAEAARNHPGQGVYRSSYKNALRLTRDQVNTAYRTADYERWQALSFVMGIQISLSNNHPLKPENEMCEHLAGKYPKSFKWTGWHIQCLCHATPIFITEAEKKARRKVLMAGEEWKGESDNQVKDVPENFKKWYSENKERLDHLKSIPDFIKSNAKYIPKEA